MHGEEEGEKEEIQEYSAYSLLITVSVQYEVEDNTGISQYFNLTL